MSRPILVAVASNLFSYVGIVYYEWNIYQLFFCYWLEMIMVILMAQFYKNLNEYAKSEIMPSFKWSLIYIWWLFWLFLHLLFIIVLLKDPMKQVLILPEGVVTASNFFLAIIVYSLLLPAVLFSTIITIFINILNFRTDKKMIDKGILKGYNTQLIAMLPYVYLVTNHLLIMLAAKYHSSESLHTASFPLMIAATKTLSDGILNCINQSKKNVVPIAP